MVHWERPSCLEELIPYDVRRRWNIVSQTAIAFPEDRNHESTQRELPWEVQVSANDKKMRQFMLENSIKTTHQTSQNLARIREWAVQKGLRIRILAD